MKDGRYRVIQSDNSISKHKMYSSAMLEKHKTGGTMYEKVLWK